jgi:arylformamidase
MYYDISSPYYPGMMVFPEDPPFTSEEVLHIGQGDICNLSRISFGSHTGTHFDAPKHFFDDGLTVDRISLDYFIGKARVCEVMGKREVAAEDLRAQGLSRGEIILIKTDNSRWDRDRKLKNQRFQADFVTLTQGAARYLVEAGIKTVGIDYLSVERITDGDFPVHKILLGNQIMIIEGLILGSIAPGEYGITGLPLNIENGNGSPIRVVLFDL